MTEAVRSDWDELMLAMDVVDTLRHREAELDRIISDEADDQELVEKVRRIYQSQGIEVSERLVRDAVAALKDERFSYTPPPDGWKRNLAHFWIDRGKWGRRTGIAALVLTLVGGGSWGVSSFRESRELARQEQLVATASADFEEERRRLGNRVGVVRQGLEGGVDFGPVTSGPGLALMSEARSAIATADANLIILLAVKPQDSLTIDQIDNGDNYRWPDSIGESVNAAGAAVSQAERALQQARSLQQLEIRFQQVSTRGGQVARDEPARVAITQATHNAWGALTTGDASAAAALTRLEQLVDAVAASYEIRVVSRPGVQSGVWRYPDGNKGARNYYIIVEAVDSSGRSLRLPITSEESGRTELTVMWGLRVPEAVYQSVRADKTDDGIIQNALFGRKSAGRLNPDFLVETTGGAITSW